MMKKRIISFLLAVGMMPVNAVFADTVDFSDKLAELKILMDECTERGIPVDYEIVNYVTIDRFESYINEDIENGMANVDYNISCINELYNEAKSNLEAYLAGEKTPFAVNRPDMSNIEKRGSALYDGENPAYSIGFGHFADAQNDIPNFQKFGTSNIQMEIGPTNVYGSFYGWNENVMGTPDVQFTRSSRSHNGEYSLKITNNTEKTANVYKTLYRVISCKPDTTYNFGCWSVGSSVNNLWISINDYDDRNYIGPSSSWVNNIFTYTTSENQTTVCFRILSENVTSVYLDDFFMYEVDENGENTGNNLVGNAGFENEIDETNISYVTKALENAETHNIGVSLLLSPHYFPTNLDESIYTENGGFIKYNIDAPAAREVVEKYLRGVLPLLKGYPALQNICLSNEPTYSTMNFPEFYNPMFREYLKDIHGTIENLNSAYGGTSYKDFSEINMPLTLSSYDAICYDWIEFNDKIFTAWHKWMAGIVEEYLPDVPLHSKMMGYLISGNEDASRSHLMRGTDLELFAEFSDYAGNDSWDYITSEDNNQYYQTMFLYNYQLTATGNPVYNSEDHIIADRDSVYSHEQRVHFTNNLWMGAVHGRSLSSIWSWRRSYDETSDFYNSVLFRPDIVAGTGKTNLDLTRLSKEVNAVMQKKPKVALYYSKPTRLYNKYHMSETMSLYKDLLARGVSVGIISEKSIDRLNEYDMIILGNVCYGSDKVYDALLAYDGKVVYKPHILSPELFKYDEYKVKRDNSALKSKAVNLWYNNLDTCLSDAGLTEVQLVDRNGSVLSDIDWQYAEYGNKLIINASNLDYGTVKNVSVYKDGEKLTGFTNLITGETNIENLSLEAYTPQLLEYTLYEFTVPAEIVNIKADGKNISWSITGDNYCGANIYIPNPDGTSTLVGTTKAYTFTAEDYGNYIVRAVRHKGSESEGEVITITDEAPFSLNISDKKISGNTAMFEIEVKNHSREYATGVSAVNLYNADGNRVNYVYNKITLKPGEKRAYTVSMSLRNAVEFEAVVWDSKISKKVISDKTEGSVY